MFGELRRRWRKECRELRLLRHRDGSSSHARADLRDTIKAIEEIARRDGPSALATSNVALAPREWPMTTTISLCPREYLYAMRCATDCHP
jgi:hypothetical protein